MLSDWMLRFRALFKRTAVEREIDEELRFHFDRQVESYVTYGLGHADAVRRARLEFGGLDQVKEEYRDALGVRLVDGFWRDLRLAVRALRATSAGAAILTLSLTLGAGASIFAVVDAVVLTPPPFANPDALVTVGETPVDDPMAAPRAVSYATFEAWRERAGSMATIEAIDGTNLTLTVLGVVSIVAAACAWICGSLPALVAARRSVADAMRRGATAPPRELILRRVFVSAEIALAFVLLVCVMLLGRSLIRVLDVNPGFDADGVLTMSVSLPAATYPSVERVVAFYSALQNALEERLGPHTIAIVDELPLTGDRGRSLVRIRPTDIGRKAVLREAGTSYFDVMRIPVVAGRSFDPRDNSSAPPRVVVSEWLAERLFAREQPIGRQILLAATAQPAEIVGVVGDVKHRALDEAPVPTVYLSAWQSPSRSRHIVVRSARPDADVLTAVSEEVARFDRNLPVYAMRPMRDLVAASPGVPATRVLTATFMGFALLAVVLGAIGFFGVVAHDVAARRAELALRVALGADPMRILSATVGQGALMLGSGLAVGGLLSIWAARVLSTVVFATDHFDVLSVAVPAAVLMIVGAGAVLPAARRAAHTDPLIALRSE